MPLSDVSHGALEYAKGLRGFVRGLWRDDISQAVFTGDISGLMERRLRQAWFEGMGECSILPNEITPVEQLKLATMIQEQMSFIPGFAADIIANSKDRGGKLTPLMTRVDQLWVNRYFQFKNEGQAMACADVKMMWVLGMTEHCSSCLKLHGKVKRGSYWTSRGILPRVPNAPYLACHGYNCACSLVPTEQPVSRGSLPALP